MNRRDRARGRAIAILTAALLAVAAVTPTASAGSGTIACYPGTYHAIGNANHGGSSVAFTWTYTDDCGKIGLSARVYVGGGAYGWTGIQWWGKAGAYHYEREFDTTMTASRHYYTYYTSGTYKALDE